MVARTDLPATLANLRKKAGLSLRALEESSGVRRSIISRVENAEVRPTPETLTKLAPALNVDASELLTAAGYTASRAEALPNMQVYLRSKYGHLSAADRERLVALLDELEQGRANKRATKRTRAK
jgi:transcriptional regulator with XRE-family HTH domain